MKYSFAAAVPLLFVLSVPAQQQPLTVACASPTTGEEQACPANTRDGVLLLREQSANLCQQGLTWSYDRYAITVRGGCSADFMISGRGSRGYKDGTAYGDHGYDSTADPVAPAAVSHATTLPRRAPPTLPQGAQLAMQLDNAIRLTALTQGEVITGILVNDLVTAGRIAAPVGSPVQARVMSAAGAPLDIRLVSLRASGFAYTLQSTPVHGMRDLVEADGGARNGFGPSHKQSVDPSLIFPGSIFLFHLLSAAQPVEAE